MNNSQKAIGFGNSQNITNIVFDENYLQHLLQFTNNPSDVNLVVLTLYDSIVKSEDIQVSRNPPPEIDIKISHNNVVTFKDVILTNYSENGYFLEVAYKALDSEVPGRKTYFLKYINNLYNQEVGALIKENSNLSKIEVVRLHSDNIISKLIIILLSKIATNNKQVAHLSRETIELNVVIIICHAFVDCKILENPKKL